MKESEGLYGMKNRVECHHLGDSVQGQGTFGQCLVQCSAVLFNLPDLVRAVLQTPPSLID